MPWLTRYQISLQFPALKFGAGCRIDAGAELLGNIELGDNVRIDMGAKLLAGGDGAMIRIGSHCHIATNAILMGAGGIAIHNHCCVGMGSKLISATDNFAGQHLVGPQYGSKPGYTDVRKAKIIMHDFAIVTTSCLLLPGATIDEGSVVGAKITIPAGKGTVAWKIYKEGVSGPWKDRLQLCKTSVAPQWEKEWHEKRAAIVEFEATTFPHQGTVRMGSSETP